jgi:integrase
MIYQTKLDTIIRETSGKPRFSDVRLADHAAPLAARMCRGSRPSRKRANLFSRQEQPQGAASRRAWTPDFMAQYEAAKRDAAPVRGVDIVPGTWRWLCVKYFAECTDYLRLSDRTKYVRRGILEGTFDEPIAPGSPRFFRDMPVSKMTADNIEVLRDRKIDFPEGANNRVKAIRQVFKWAARKRGPDGRPYAFGNPAREVSYLKSNNPSGYHTWSIEEVQQYENRHPIGSKARLALALLLFTGQRRSDVTRFGRQHVRNGRLTFTQFKGRNRKPKVLVLPILPVLQRIIDASPCGKETFLVTEHGKPFTDAGFGNWFADRCKEAGVPGRAHGLRKAGASIAATNGATAHQLMAVFGWDTLKMAEAYTRKADQQRLAASAMHLLGFEPDDAEVCPTEKPGGTFLEENVRKSMPFLAGGAQERTRTSTAFTTGT